MGKGGLLKQLYQKQRKRVLNYISRARKKGYTFEIEIPPIPQNPTKKDVNFFKNITPQKLRENGYYVSEETGEFEQAQEAFKRKRKEAAIKAAQTRKRVDAEEFDYNLNETLSGEDFVIDRFMSIFDEVRMPSDTKRYYRRKPDAVMASQQKSLLVLEKLDDAINQQGTNAVAQIIYDNYGEIESAVEHLVYGYDLNEINSGFYPIIRILNGGTMTIQDAKRLGEIEDTDFPTY